MSKYSEHTDEQVRRSVVLPQPGAAWGQPGPAVPPVVSRRFATVLKDYSRLRGNSGSDVPVSCVLSGLGSFAKL